MKSCLIIDDDAVNRYVQVAIVESLQIKTFEVDNAISAISFCEEQMPDIVIIDWIMPKMDGLEFAEALRNLKNGNKPYVILCSGRKCDRNDFENIKNVGINLFIEKPMRIESLKKSLSEANVI